jgi:hypothetical protein
VLIDCARDLSENFLSGDLPLPMLGHAELSYVDLANNALNGTIPQEITDMAAVRVLYVDAPPRVD